MGFWRRICRRTPNVPPPLHERKAWPCNRVKKAGIRCGKLPDLGRGRAGVQCRLVDAAHCPGFVIGIAAQTLTTTTNGLIQTSTEPHMRGRVIAILLALALGGTPIGAPIVGWVADTFGPRWALGVGAAAGFLAAAIAALYLLRLRYADVVV